MAPFLHRAATMKENPLWLIVLCDMMTNLMLFFLVMYSFTLQDPQARQAWAHSFDAAELVEDPKKRRLEEVLRRFQEREAAPALRELLRGARLSDAADVAETEEGIRVRLRERLLFKTGQAELDPRATRALALLSRVLGEISNTVVVEGHTDDVPVAGGAYKTNWELSIARSYAVIERLIVEGVPARRLVASGYGERHPAASNGTPEGRERNRRVEIVILKTKGGAGG